MAVFELYSTRNKAKYPEVFQYDKASPKLRNQLVQIVRDAIGCAENIYDGSGYGSYRSKGQETHELIFDILSKEYGEHALVGHKSGSFECTANLILKADIIQLIDLIELIGRVLEKVIQPDVRNYMRGSDAKQKPDDALKEINERMKRDGFGYEYNDGVIVRIDEQFIHAEVVKPALVILQDFKGAQEEFLSAHEHYRHGAYEECIADCNKSFESLMKAICSERGWEYDSTAQAKKLIKTCLDNKLIPAYMQEQFAQFINLLSSGIPTIRNKEAGHGQGEEIRVTPQHLVSYALHLTASNIVFLGQCNKDLR